MKTANGYLELANPVSGANNLSLSVIERMDNGDMRQATAKLDPSDIASFVAQLLSLRGILDEVNQQRPPREVEKIVDRPVEVPTIVQVDRVIEVPKDVPVDEIVSKVLEGIKASQAPADPQPAEEVKP